MFYPGKDTKSLRKFKVRNIHPRDMLMTVSGKKHKSLTMQPNGALGSMKTCLYSWTGAHYNNTACLNLLFKLSWNIKKRNLVTNLPVPSSQSSIVLHCPSLIVFTRQGFFKRVYLCLIYQLPWWMNWNALVIVSGVPKRTKVKT